MTTTIPDMPNQQARAAAGTDPRGWLVFDAPLPSDLQRAEDATQAADFARWTYRPRCFDRPATDTERALLEHLGYTVPAELTTQVSYRSKSTRHRSWPVLQA